MNIIIVTLNLVLLVEQYVLNLVHELNLVLKQKMITQPSPTIILRSEYMSLTGK